MLAELFVAASINSLLVGPAGGEIENDIIQLVGVPGFAIRMRSTDRWKPAVKKTKTHGFE